MGRFLLGSTVVMLFPQGQLELQSRMGAEGGNPHGRSDGRADRLTRVSGGLIAGSAAAAGSSARRGATRSGSWQSAAPTHYKALSLCRLSLLILLNNIFNKLLAIALSPCCTWKNSPFQA
jgi:hypothetical protein